MDLSILTSQNLSPSIGGKRDKAAVKLTVVCEAPIKTLPLTVMSISVMTVKIPPNLGFMRVPGHHQVS